MADISHHLLLVDYAEYSPSMWGPILGERLDAERERQRQKKERQKVEAQVQNPVAPQVQKWVGELASGETDDSDLIFQQQLLNAGGQSGGWKDELFDEDLLYLNRREWDMKYINDVEWRKAREEFAKFEPRARLEPADAVPVLLPRPKAGVDHPYRNLITFADRNGHTRQDLPGKGQPRMNWTLEQDYCPTDPVPRKNLDGGYARQPEWPKKANPWAAIVDRIAQPPKMSLKGCPPVFQESESVKVTGPEKTKAGDAILGESLSIQDQTSVSSTPLEIGKVTPVMGRKRKAALDEASPSTKPMPKKRRLRSALGEVNC